MITAKMLSQNLKTLILRIATGAPWLTHRDIADWVGCCSLKYVCRVLNDAGIYRQEQANCAHKDESRSRLNWRPPG